MKMINSTSIRIIATFLSIVMLFSSCRLYHIKSRSILHNNAERLLSKKVSPQFILHCGNNYWQIKNPVIKDSMVSGVLVSVDEKVDYIYRKALTKRNFRVSSIDEYQANQLHIYVEAFEFDGKFAKVNMNEIKELKILDKKLVSIPEPLSITSIVKNSLSADGNNFITILPPLSVCLMPFETKLYIIFPSAFLSNQINNSGI